MENKYYIPTFKEILNIGFKGQSCYECIRPLDSKEEWFNIEIDKEFIDNYSSLILNDAYETEFRAIK